MTSLAPDPTIATRYMSARDFHSAPVARAVLCAEGADWPHRWVEIIIQPDLPGPILLRDEATAREDPIANGEFLGVALPDLGLVVPRLALILTQSAGMVPTPNATVHALHRSGPVDSERGACLRVVGDPANRASIDESI